MDGESAPITVRHFLELALHDHYYDGLTFHRVVPNFVIQGGSPGANEYSGPGRLHARRGRRAEQPGVRRLSTRGRNTGDAQFFVNLVDNTRLDYDYTVFAKVFASGHAGGLRASRKGTRSRRSRRSIAADEGRHATGVSSSLIVPASASISTCTPSGSVHCGC